nr:uncharacterized protein LOC116149485 [Camelus dromedarius]
MICLMMESPWPPGLLAPVGVRVLTALCPQRQPVRGCAPADPVPVSLVPHLDFKHALLKPSRELGVFLGTSRPVPLARPCRKPFSAPHSDVSARLASRCIRRRNAPAVTSLEEASAGVCARGWRTPATAQQPPDLTSLRGAWRDSPGQMPAAPRQEAVCSRGSSEATVHIQCHTGSLHCLEGGEVGKDKQTLPPRIRKCRLTESSCGNCSVSSS